MIIKRLIREYIFYNLKKHGYVEKNLIQRVARKATHAADLYISA